MELEGSFSRNTNIVKFPKTLGYKISIIIPAYNEYNNLKYLIPHLEKLNFYSWKITEILVDISGSTDGSRDLLDSFVLVNDKVYVIDTGTRDGLIKSLMRLISRAVGDIIVRMDADITFEDQALDLLINEMSDPNVGIVGPRVVPRFDNKSFVNNISATAYNIHHLVSLSHPKTTNLQVFRNVEITFPKDARVEDILIQNIILSKGFKVKYVQSSIINISPPYTLKEYIKQRVRNIEIQGWYKKYSGKSSPTQKFQWVARAILNAFGKNTGETNLFTLLSFLTIEISCLTFARSRRIFYGHIEYQPWEQTRGTKRTYWSKENNGKN
jgi:glycosyltransferase involved in cell wall biosynthesis